MTSKVDSGALAFSEWEERGRGWHRYDTWVTPEPPFVPFSGHNVPGRRIHDDGQIPTIASRIVDFFRGAGGPESEVPAESQKPEHHPLQDCLDYRGELLEFKVTLSQSFRPDPGVFDQFLVSCAHARFPLTYNILGTGDSIDLLLAVDSADARHLREQLHAYFPDASITEVTGLIFDSLSSRSVEQSFVFEVGLNDEFMIPLGQSRSPGDVIVGIAGALSNLTFDETGIFQVIFEPVFFPWSQSILRSVTNGSGQPYFAHAPELAQHARNKVSEPLFATVVRIGGFSRDLERSTNIGRSLFQALTPFGRSPGNLFIPLENEEDDPLEHLAETIYGRTRRSGMILSMSELTSFVRFPSPAVRTPKFSRETKRTHPVLSIAQNTDLILGTNNHAGREITAGLSTDQRTRHIYAVGASGTGKSNFLLGSILQDIANGQGFGVLDPHGDLIDTILARIPDERQKDVVLIDPSDEEYSVGFNILQAHSDTEKTILASDLVSVFRRQSTSWGDQMTTVLSNAVLAFLESTQGGTLLDLRRFLVEPQFRNQILKTVTDSEVRYFWNHEFKLITGKPQASVLTRLNTFLRPKTIRYMIAQKDNRLDFANIMDEGKILLAKLPHGTIGEENSYLLGTLLVTKFYQVVMGRQTQATTDRRPFWLYLDEFHNFVTPTMASILSGARKYKLGLVLAHQDLKQLAARDTEVESSVISNPYTRVCFRLGEQDSRKLSEGFAHFDQSDLQSLGIGQAIARVERSDSDFNLAVDLVPPEPGDAADRRRLVIDLSRHQYAKPRAEIEAELSIIPSLSPSGDGLEKPEPRSLPGKTKKTEVQTIQVDQDQTITPQPTECTSSPAEVQAFDPQTLPTPPHDESEIVDTSHPPPSPPPIKVVEESPEILPGRGGKTHKHLQGAIKSIAEGMGFHAGIEAATPDGTGSVDVLLTKDELTVGVEISVTTPVEHELGNLCKCLNANFKLIVMVSPDPAHLAKIKQAAQEAFTQKEQERLRFFIPEKLAGFFEELEAQGMESVSNVLGYKVKVKYSHLSEGERQERREVIAKTLAKAIKPDSE